MSGGYEHIELTPLCLHFIRFVGNKNQPYQVENDKKVKCSVYYLIIGLIHNYYLTTTTRLRCHHNRAAEDIHTCE